MSRMGSHSSGESRRVPYNRGTYAPAIGAGAAFVLSIVFSSAAFAQTPAPTIEANGKENARDDHSYLPPSMQSQIELGKSPAALKTETQIPRQARTASLQRRRAKRQSWANGWGRRGGWGLFD
jgi:hypothetical protein